MAALGIGIFIAVLAMALSLAENNSEKNLPESIGFDAKEPGLRAEKPVAARESASAEEPALRTEKTAPCADKYDKNAVSLTAGQDGLLRQIYERMGQGDLAGAASCMERREAEIASLLETSFKGRRFLYDGKGAKEVIEGKGIVLTSPSTVFYGNFKNGAPRGMAVAMREIVLGAPRYDYSIGFWKQGKMNGEGVSGYFYYKGAGENDGLKTEKTGMFQDDLMEGEVRYTSIDGSGDSATWILNVKEGAAQIDDRWKLRESQNEYFLPAENDSSHGYVVKKSDMGGKIWINRIQWEP